VQAWIRSSCCLRWPSPAPAPRLALRCRQHLPFPRSPQGHPFLTQAGSSGQGIALAARYADAVFTPLAGTDAEAAARKDELEAAASTEFRWRNLANLAGLDYTTIDPDAPFPPALLQNAPKTSFGASIYQLAMADPAADSARTRHRQDRVRGHHPPRPRRSAASRAPAVGTDPCKPAAAKPRSSSGSCVEAESLTESSAARQISQAGRVT
jgi:hypothetical protein